MIKHGSPPYLECSSRGEKRFSAFHAKLRQYNNLSIEDIYQGAKVFPDGSTGLPWRLAKGKRCVNAVEVGQLYGQLWEIYLGENPHLVDLLLGASGLSDMFGQAGHVCQATELWRIRNLLASQQYEIHRAADAEAIGPTEEPPIMAFKFKTGQATSSTVPAAASQSRAPSEPMSTNLHAQPGRATQPCAYAIATTLERGVESSFDEGPYDVFPQAAFQSGSGIVFRIGGATGESVPAFDEMHTCVNQASFDPTPAAIEYWTTVARWKTGLAVEAATSLDVLMQKSTPFSEALTVAARRAGHDGDGDTLHDRLQKALTEIAGRTGASSVFPAGQLLHTLDMVDELVLAHVNQARFEADDLKERVAKDAAGWVVLRDRIWATLRPAVESLPSPAPEILKATPTELKVPASTPAEKPGKSDPNVVPPMKRAFAFGRPKG